MPKKQYILRLSVTINPAVVIAQCSVRFIDPEMARGSADYVRNYRCSNSPNRRTDDMAGLLWPCGR